jgi:hypothetical protein
MQSPSETLSTRWLSRPSFWSKGEQARQQNHAFTRIWHTPSVRGVRHLFSAKRWYRYLTAGERRLPNYIIAGAQKCGTTSLYAYLCEHPQVCPPMTKEMSFFDNRFDRGLRWYQSNFPRRDEIKRKADRDLPLLTGESTAYYLFHPHAARRIAETLPDIKIILLLRNPVERAYSHYQLNVRRGNETLSFEAAIEAEVGRLRSEKRRMQLFERYHSFAHEKYSYLARGRYAEQIEVWQQHFDSSQLLILESGELFSETAAVFDRVLEFLDLPAWRPERFGNRFPGRYQDPMSESTRHRLTDYFAPHNERLYYLLGKRFEWDEATVALQAA